MWESVELHTRGRCGGTLLRMTCAGVLAASAAAASAQEQYPSRPVRLVVAFAPGGGTDIVARSLAARLSTRFGQQFVVDNRPGGGGVTGIELVARAQPDGYTLLVVSSSFAANAVMRKTSYDPIKGFQPISLLSRQALLVLVHPSVPTNNMKELIAFAKAKPGALSYGSSGNGGIQHLATEMLKSMANVDIVHVPYKGTAPALNDLMAGQIQMSLLSIVASLSQVRSGKLKGLAVSSSSRSDGARDSHGRRIRGARLFVLWMVLHARAREDAPSHRERPQRGDRDRDASAGDARSPRRGRKHRGGKLRGRARRTRSQRDREAVEARGGREDSPGRWALIAREKRAGR